MKITSTKFGYIYHDSSRVNRPAITDYEDVLDNTCKCDSCQKYFELADLVDPGSGATFCKECLSEEIKENNQAEYTGDDN